MTVSISFSRRFFTACLGGLLFLAAASPAEAFLFHATRKAAAKRIMARGFNPAKFKADGRFGKGLYLSRTKAGALAEKGKSSAVLRVTPSPKLGGKTIDLRQPKSGRLRELSGRSDLRGAVKHDVIGPKLGRSLGQAAERRGLAIQYRSAKTGGSNLVIPKGVLEKQPNLVRVRP